MLIASYKGSTNTLELHGSHDNEYSQHTIYFTVHTTDGKEVSVLGRGWTIAEAKDALNIIANGEI